MRLNAAQPSFFDVPYSIPSTSVTTGNTTIATAPSDYWGFAIIVSSAPVTITIYNSVTALGVVLDVTTLTASQKLIVQNPTRARVGLSVNLTGTNGSATIFYTPKG